MYSLKLDIGGLQLIQECSLEGCSLIRSFDGDSIRLRDTIDGEVTIYGNSYDLIKNYKLSDTPNIYAEILYDNEVKYTGLLYVNGSWNDQQRKCKLPIQIDDIYTKIYQQYEKETTYTHRGAAFTTIPVTDQVLESRAVGYTDPTANQIDISGFSYCGDNPFLEFWDPETQYYKAVKVDDLNDTGNSGYIESRSPGIVRYGSSATYVAILDSVNKEPGSGSEYWLQLDHSEEYKSIYSESGIKFDGAVQFNDENLWRKGSCVKVSQTFNFANTRLYDMLVAGFANIDNSIIVSYTNIPNNNLYDLVIYTNDEEEFTFSLKRILAIYKTLFNTDWRIKDNVLEFINPKDFQQTSKGSYSEYPYQYINRIYANDFSSGDINDNERNYVLENFIIGNVTNAKVEEFQETGFRYDVPFLDELTTENTDIEVDFAWVTQYGSLPTVLAIEQLDRTLFNTVGEYSGARLYNGELALSRLIPNYFTYDRLYKYGQLVVLKYFPEQDFTLNVKAYERTDNETPMPVQDLIDFDYLVETVYGWNQITKITVNLDTLKSIVELYIKK